MPKRAYIVEDHADMRMILKRVLKRSCPALKEIGESDTAERALEEVISFCPDLILVDISLPGLNGIELIKLLRPRCQAICILVVTAHEIELYRKAALEAGANDIVSKADLMKLMDTIRDVFGDSCKEGQT